MLSSAQLDNNRSKCFPPQKRLKLDSLIVDPESIRILPNNAYYGTSTEYQYDLNTGILEFAKEPADSICIEYHVINFSVNRVYKDHSKPNFPDTLLPDEIERARREIQTIGANPLDLGSFERSGSISRGLSFGNNQSVVLNSGLNLQLSGELSPGVELSAYITDRNLPFQPEGQTQTIQDFDRVFIQLKTQSTRVIVGDFDLFDPQRHFLSYRKNVKGARIDHRSKIGKANLSQSLNASVGRGKFARILFNGQEGNQGPYRLRGAEGEQFIVILATSERVFFDGQLLKRGEQYDYTIDYNTAEITFTPRRLITNQSRLIVEFEYANQAYVRSVLAYQSELNLQKSKFHLNIYNEQDARNQSLQQDLSAEEVLFLQNSIPGSELKYPSPRRSEFSANQILYERVDSSGFIYYRVSIDSTKELYSVSFSFVGEGKGDYSQISSNANGRVYAFSIPDLVGGDTIRTGSYIPFLELIAPSRRQMITLGYDYQPSEQSHIGIELASSSNDPNLFYEGDFKDRGYAAFFQAKHSRKLNILEKEITLVGEVQSEFLNDDFRILQPYRSAEFARDWNIEKNFTDSREFLNDLSLGLVADKLNYLRYRLKSVDIALNEYSGVMNRIDAGFGTEVFNVKAYQDGKKIAGDVFEGSFDRRQVDVNYMKGSFHWSASLEEQKNTLRTGDSLSLSSFQFYILNSGLRYKSGNGNSVGLHYMRRQDRLPELQQLKTKELGQSYSLDMDLNFSRNQFLVLTTSYRELKLFDFQEQKEGKEQSVLSQVEYRGKLAKGLLDYQFFYSYNRGQEALRDFAFVEVPLGQGNYQWQDSNGDSIAQVNEFLPAVFADSARYIKVFTQSNSFVPTFQSKYNQRISLNPSRLFRNSDKKFAKTISRISALSSFSINRKTQDDRLNRNLNPFLINELDTQLVFSNSQIRNTLFINRRDPRFGLDINSIRTIAKSLSTNGLALRQRQEENARFRLNLGDKLNTELMISNGVKISDIELFEINSYEIAFREFKPRLNYISQGKLRLSLIYSNKYSNNSLSETEQTARSNDLTAEFAVNFSKKGLLQFRFSNLQIDYTGTLNNPASFEMLQGLQPGSNQLWNLSFLRTFANNLQLNLSYDGRKSENFPVVHSAKVQARILF